MAQRCFTLDARQRFLEGTWCGGITPAQHAGGPGFNPQRAHFQTEGDIGKYKWHGGEGNEIAERGFDPRTFGL